MIKRVIISVIVVAIFFAAIFGLFYFRAMKAKQFMAQMASRRLPPTVVSSGTVSTMLLPQEIHVVGSISAIQGVQVSAQISGNVTGIYFHSGQQVKAGEKLVQIDNTTQLAQLKADLAALKLARINLARTKNLIAHQAASQATLDADNAALLQATALVAGDRANLAKLAITAPFTGYLGLRLVSLGQYVSPGTPIVALNTWQPIYLEFSIPQNQLAQVKLGETVHFSVDAYPGDIFTGKLTALSSQIDTNSRNIQLQATMPNKRLLLKPGLFGKVALLTGVTNKVMVVNSDAITYNTFGDFVYLINKTHNAGKTELKVSTALVHVGPQIGNDTVITSGLKVGQEVVTAGQIKLRPGAAVVVNNTIKP